MKKSFFQKYAAPEAWNYPGYFWIINAKMELPEMLEQLRDMAAHGARSVCLHPAPRFRPNTFTSMEPDYLSPEYTQIIAALVEECRRLDMNYYFYDEGGYPSGSACGRVYRSDPERFVRQYVVPDGPDNYKIIKENVSPSTPAPLPNIIAQGATETFIKLTHDTLYKAIGKKHFGTTIRFAFTDEVEMPKCGPHKLGWTSDFPEVFRKKKGYDIEPYLAKIANSNNDVNRCSPLMEIKLDYVDVMADLMVERYLLPLRDWCREHNILSGGHFAGEESWYNAIIYGYGHLMRSLRAMDFPGVDAIWRQVYPGQRLHPFPKLASSVANQSGRREVLGELFALYGACSPDCMKGVIDYMLVCGVNRFVFSNIPMKNTDLTISSSRPKFGPSDPLWKFFNSLHEYTARASYLMSQGKPVVDTALFFDHRSLWLCQTEAVAASERAIRIGLRLQETQRDFDYVDDDVLETAKVRNGRLLIGKMSYANLIIPRFSRMTKKAESRIEEFRKKGVRILDTETLDVIPPTVEVLPATWKIQATCRDFGNGVTGYFVVNTSETQVKCRLTVPEERPAAVSDSMTGKFYPVDAANGSWEWTFKPFESRWFFFGLPETELSPVPKQPGEMVKQLNNWFMAPVLRYDFKVRNIEKVVCNEKKQRCKTGDWRSVLGEKFTGDVAYTTRFTLSAEEASKIQFLDLGKVNYAAEVKLNGKLIGFSMLSPFCFDVQDALKTGSNTLEVIVTNTLANALSGEDTVEAWKKEFGRIGSFEDRQRDFETESLESGLFGPVVLCSALKKNSEK